jgi:hypothetical protein
MERVCLQKKKYGQHLKTVFKALKQGRKEYLCVLILEDVEKEFSPVLQNI